MRFGVDPGNDLFYFAELLGIGAMESVEVLAVPRQ
jgi:hypothetical protein